MTSLNHLFFSPISLRRIYKPTHERYKKIQDDPLNSLQTSLSIYLTNTDLTQMSWKASSSSLHLYHDVSAPNIIHTHVYCNFIFLMQLLYSNLYISLNTCSNIKHDAPGAGSVTSVEQYNYGYIQYTHTNARRHTHTHIHTHRYGKARFNTRLLSIDQ